MQLTQEACDRLTQYPWPGNIRELEHTIEKAVIISEEDILPASLFKLSQQASKPADAQVSTLEEMERQMIQKAMQNCNGNLSAVAAQLGITRQTLYNKMKKYGL